MTVGELIDILKNQDPSDDVNIYLLSSGERIPLRIEDIDFLVRDCIEFNVDTEV